MISFNEKYELAGFNFIVKSKNYSSSDLDANLQQSELDKIKSKAELYHLSVPNDYFEIQETYHCLAMSLHFLKYNQSDASQIDARAKHLVTDSGINSECKKTSKIYHNLFAANSVEYHTHSDNQQLLLTVQQCVTEILGMAIQKDIILIMSIERILEYFQTNLPQGRYLITLPGHTMALIKDEKNDVYIFNPDEGVMKITSNPEGIKWFTSLLKICRLDLTESLTLHSIGEKGKKESNLIIDGEPIIAQESGKGRWRKFHVRRGKTKYDFVLDALTGDLYNKDSKSLIRFKCFLLAIGRTFIDTTIITLYHTAKVIKGIYLLTFGKIYGRKKLAENFSLRLMQSFYDIFRTPVYGMLMWGAALMGIVCPYRGRSLYGRLARTYARHQQYGIDYHDKFYTAPCFNPINFKRDKNEAIREHLNRIQSLKRRSHPCIELMFGWRRAVPCFKK